MRYFIVLFAFWFTNIKGQSSLTFDHRYVESENKWVAIRTDKDTLLNYGFIYLDESAGLTLNYEGSFTISKDGKFIAKKLENVGMKYRLKPNNVKVAIIPSTKYNELGIKEYPDWLKIYLGDTTSVSHLYRCGFLYNGYEECLRALTFLEKAHKINPDFKGVRVELAFSYNCLGRYDKAISVLKEAIESNPNGAYFYKELIFAQIKSGKLDIASETCKKAIAVCTDKTYNGENCYNLLYTFYQNKDKINFMRWVEDAKKWNENNAKLTDGIKSMESEIAK